MSDPIDKQYGHPRTWRLRFYRQAVESRPARAAVLIRPGPPSLPLLWTRHVAFPPETTAHRKNLERVSESQKIAYSSIATRGRVHAFDGFLFRAARKAFGSLVQ